MGRTHPLSSPKNGMYRRIEHCKHKYTFLVDILQVQRILFKNSFSIVIIFL